MAECMLEKRGGGVLSEDLTATAAQVLTGYTYVGKDSDDDPKTGSMPNRGAISQTMYATTADQAYTVPAGYHNGSGKVNVKKITQSNIAAGNIKKGVTVTVNNGSSNVVSVTGTLPYTPHMADFKRSEPNNNYDYNETWTIPYTGTVYFSWSFSSNSTSGYFVYINGTKYSNSRSGSFEINMAAGDTIRWGYTGAHASSDHYGSVNMITMTTV